MTLSSPKSTALSSTKAPDPVSKPTLAFALALANPNSPTTTTIRRGRPAAASLVSVPVLDDPERRENSLIVSLLRDMLGRTNTTTTTTTTTSASTIALNKRCRENEEKFYQNRISRPVSSIKETLDDFGMEIVNKNCVVVDFNALATRFGDPYGPELKRRTVGLETEEGLSAFLRGLEGQLGIRRKRRKVGC